jgi:hypothetical protein
VKGTGILKVVKSMTLTITWIDDLIGCPSQCTGYIRHDTRDEHCQTLYLRWRTTDPWQFYVIKGCPVHPFSQWTIDLFQRSRITLPQETDIEQLKEIAVIVYRQLMNQKKLSETSRLWRS